MRVLVTGGRDYNSYEDRMWLYAGLNLLHSMSPITEIIEGDANGFDLSAKNWALWRKACGDRLTLTTKRPDWARYGDSAGPIRNKEMADLRPDVVLVCPGGPGTRSMTEIAQAAGLRIVRLEKMPVVKGAPIAERPSEQRPRDT